MTRLNVEDGGSTPRVKGWLTGLKWCMGLLLAVGLLMLFYVPRCAHVGGIMWWHIQRPFSSSNTCLVEVVTWRGETVCCRFMQSPLDVSVVYDGFLVLWEREADAYQLRYYDVKEKRFLSSIEFRHLNLSQRDKPHPGAADDWHLTDLYNITGDRSCKYYWIQRAERDFSE